MAYLSRLDYEKLPRLNSRVAEQRHPLGRAETFLPGYLALCGAETVALLSARPDDGFYAVEGGLMQGLQDDPVNRLQDWYSPERQDGNDPRCLSPSR